MTASSSRIFDFPITLTRVAIADTTIADVTVVGPRQLMVVAHKPGATTLSVWQEDGEYFERSVRIEQGGPQQVQLRVVVAELDRSRLEAQGLDLSVALANAGISVVGLQGQVATPYNVQTNLTATGGAGTIVALPPSGVLTPGGSLIPLLLSNSITYGLASTNGQWTTNAMFQFLEQHELAKILAEPMLIAASGEQAKFLSGGEIPIVIAQALNTSIVFKQFGTSVVFVPTVIDDDEIELEVAPEFSQPDFTQGVADVRVYRARLRHPQGADAGAHEGKPDPDSGRPDARQRHLPGAQDALPGRCAISWMPSSNIPPTSATKPN